MSGYVPLFESITTGTLYGRWPDIGLWPIVLAIADKNGVIDVTPQYLAGVTGLAVNEVIACMERFCAPDPLSRSQNDAGARLALLDRERSWGWRVINHAKYREKARLMAKNASEVSAGKNRDRMSHRRGPPMTPSQTHTQTHTKTSESEALKSAFSGKEVSENIQRLRKTIGSGLKRVPLHD